MAELASDLEVARTNGELPQLTDAERHAYYDMLRETARGDAEAAGVMSEGEDAYAADWQMNLEWDKPCPDNIAAEVTKATFVVAQRYKRGTREGLVRPSTLRRMHLGGREIQQLREATNWTSMAEDLSTAAFDAFAYGATSTDSVGGLLGQYTPLWPGPVTRQLYWQDYWKMSAQAFEAYNHDPISWRCIHMKEEFALGRGLDTKITIASGSKQGQTHEAATKAWREFWKRNKMTQRFQTIARDYCWSGEQFLRYFKSGSLLTVRALDPASIYDLITDPEDIETVFAYHQQFQTPYQLYPPDKTKPTGEPTAPTGASSPGASVKYIIRQILPQEIDHYKNNASGYERRGRSDLFPALGWIKRLRDYLTAHVVQADMMARICWDLEVAGNQQAIQNLRNNLFPGGRAPTPGTVFSHNTASKLQPVVPHRTTGASGRGDPILDALVTMVSLSAGLPKDWLGFGMNSTRAGALVATEPASKSMEDLQGTMELMIHDCFDRVMEAARISDAVLEVTFPSIAQEDRQQKLDDLGTMEANQYISKQTAAEIAAKEMNITTYDYDAEQKLIAQEFDDSEETDGKTESGKDKPAQGGKVRRTMIVATKRQAPKLDPTKAAPPFDDDPAGLAIPLDGSAPATRLPAPGSPDGTGRTVAGGGSHPAEEENPRAAAGKTNLRKEGTTLRQSGDTIEVPAGEYWRMVREVQQPQRRAVDPGYQRDRDEYMASATENLAQLAGSIVEATRDGMRLLEAERQSMRDERTEHRGFLGRLRRGAEPESPEGGSEDE